MNVSGKIQFKSQLVYGKDAQPVARDFRQFKTGKKFNFCP